MSLIAPREGSATACSCGRPFTNGQRRGTCSTCRSRASRERRKTTAREDPDQNVPAYLSDELGPCESAQTVELQRKRPSQTTFTTVEQLQTDASGNFSTKRKVKKTFQYRAQVAETDACLGQTSNTEKVTVKKKR
jgi:hypothetical protein